MALNLSLPDLRLSRISGQPKLYVDEESDSKSKKTELLEESWRFIFNVGECSPYLRKVIAQEKDWLESVIDLPIGIILEDILTEINQTRPKGVVLSCKIAKRRGFLITALFDLAGRLSLGNVSNILTVIADNILSVLTDKIMGTDLKNQSDFISIDDNYQTSESNQKNGPKFFILAMGKMGAHELNYSSDIDIIFFLSSKKSHGKDEIYERRQYIIKARKLVRTLSQMTEDEFIYRTDLRLRPDPASTPIVVSTKFAENYYQKFGRTWERMAFIKARPVAGDKLKARAFLVKLEDFIWRKHFDYASIEDVKNLREKMKLDSVSMNLEIISGYNIKIGLGGIRDIELFTQTYQLIVGGRLRELRNKQTITTLSTLAEMKWLKREQAYTLIEAYIFFRSVENRLQMINNTQTQILPIENSVKFLHISRLLGFEDPSLFKKKITYFLRYVKDLTGDFFTNFKFREVGKARELVPNSTLIECSSQDHHFFSGRQGDIQNFNNLRELPIFRSPRALKSFEALMPELIEIVSRTADPSYTFSQFSKFLKELSSGVQLFSLLENNPGLLNIFLQICQSSSSIAKTLSDDITLFDLLTSEKFLQKIRSKRDIRSSLQLRLERGSDFEFLLNEFRRFVKERKFQICVHLILNKISPYRAAVLFSETAELCIELLPSLIRKNLIVRYGAPYSHVPCILAMGKLGSQEMNFYSDLDLILIYDSKAKYDPGKKNHASLSAYFARFTQSLVSAFTSLTEEGRLYEVDMRLRPSGKQGPVATSLLAFDSYQKEKAWVWEHMALSRGRIISGDETIRKQVLGVFDSVFGKKIHTIDTIKEQTLKMRHSLEEKFSSKFTPPDIKFGRGGMQELELLVQMGFLLSNLKYKWNKQSPRLLIKRLYDEGFFTKGESHELLSIHDLYFNYQQISCIFVVKISDTKKLSNMGLVHLLDCISDRNLCKEIETVEELNSVLVEKSNFVGDLFDKKIQ
mgnify:CR=1 FL=1